jgi:hypothetical protein
MGTRIVPSLAVELACQATPAVVGPRHLDDRGLRLAVYLRETFFATAAWWSFLAPLAVTAVVDLAIIRTLGDAARYLHRTAQNTGRRVDILSKGVELLRAVHDSGRYDRVIVVGHSLGSVIGYDILTYTWNLYHAGRRNAQSTSTVDLLEKLATEGSLEIEAYQHAQRRYHQELRSVGNEWLVTDFVTVGSPLAHAAVLLADSLEHLRMRQQEREFPTCPPVLDGGQFTIQIPVETDGQIVTASVPHHAAVFGSTRWTNIYFVGDIVAGPLRSVFGLGIRDISVKTRWRHYLRSHTRYWSLPNEGAETSDTVKALRYLVNLEDQAARR